MELTLDNNHYLFDKRQQHKAMSKADRQTNRRTDKKTDRQTDRQTTDRQTDRQTDVILIENKVARPQFKNDKFHKPCEKETSQTFIR